VTALGIVGASGYSGAAFAALAMRHPHLELAFVTSDKWVGEPVATRLGLRDCKLSFRSHADALGAAAEVDVVVLATSAEQAVKLAPAISTRARVVDMSGGFRLAAASYPRWYGFDHPAPAELERAFYGLPELFGPPPKTTRIVANPGCYATAALLATSPLVQRDLVSKDRVIIDGKSGATGAGRRSEDAYSFVEVAEDVRAYKVGTHPHTAEIGRHLHAGVTFTPHLLPVRRGLLATAYLTARDGVTTDTVVAALEQAYQRAPFVRVVPIDDVSIHAAAGTPLAFIGAAVADGMVVTVCAIDNLMKGAASQAMQNVNALLDLPDATGLDHIVRFAP
jgi:N-acetyl-gamma-glutamyl-phosphate reductase